MRNWTYKFGSEHVQSTGQAAHVLLLLWRRPVVGPAARRYSKAWHTSWNHGILRHHGCDGIVDSLLCDKVVLIAGSLLHDAPDSSVRFLRFNLAEVITQSLPQYSQVLRIQTRICAIYRRCHRLRLMLRPCMHHRLSHASLR